MTVYADASALVKRYVREPGSDETMAVLESAAVVATSVISRVEVGAALARAVRQGRIAASAGSRAQRAFDRDWENVAKLPVSEVVLDRAVRMAWRNGLRGYDAVQLATALEWEQAGGDGAMVLTTFDRQLADAGVACGLTIWPRQEHLAGGGGR